MKKRDLIGFYGYLTLAEYLFIAGVLVHRIGWLDGLAVACAFSMLVGALRTKTTWDDLMETWK